MISKIHARNPNYSTATLCNEYRVVEKTWDKDKVACKNCLRILARRK